MKAEKKFEHSQTPHLNWNFNFYIISKLDAGWKENLHSQIFELLTERWIEKG